MFSFDYFQCDMATGLKAFFESLARPPRKFMVFGEACHRIVNFNLWPCDHIIICVVVYSFQCDTATGLKAFSESLARPPRKCVVFEGAFHKGWTLTFDLAIASYHTMFSFDCFQCEIATGMEAFFESLVRPPKRFAVFGEACHRVYIMNFNLWTCK